MGLVGGQCLVHPLLDVFVPLLVNPLPSVKVEKGMGAIVIIARLWGHPLGTNGEIARANL